MKKQAIFNSSGDAFVLTLIALGIVSVLSLLVVNLSMTIQQRRQIARAKSILTSTQQKIIDLALEPTSYQDCNSESIDSCKINLNVFKSFTDQPFLVPGAKCSSSQGSCGVEVDIPILTLNTTEVFFETKIKYTGVDFSFKDIVIKQLVPYEILQSSAYSCKVEEPLFMGLRSEQSGTKQKGTPICSAINTCPQGQYVKSINKDTMQPVCESLPSSLDCGINNFISSFQWLGGVNTNVTCAPRIDPFFQPWWDGGDLKISNGTNSKKNVRTSIDSVPDARPLDSAEYFNKKGVESWAYFAVQFSVKGSLKSLDCGKIKLHNDSVGYDVSLTNVGVCEVNLSQKKITFRGDAICKKDWLCNGHWYTITVQKGAAVADDGSENKITKRQFKVDPI